MRLAEGTNAFQSWQRFPGRFAETIAAEFGHAAPVALEPRTTQRFVFLSTQEEMPMKARTIALATALALSSTFAFAQQNGSTGAQGGATGVPGVKTNPTPAQASEGGSTGVPGVKTEPTPDQATSTSGTSRTPINKGTADPAGSTAQPKGMTK
jgi:hypothetical protein